MKRLFPLILILWQASDLSAQMFQDPAFRQAALNGMSQTYNFEFQTAHQTFSQLVEAHPEHPAPYFLQAFNRWWQTFLSMTMPDYYDYIEDRLELAEDKLDNLEDQSGYEAELAFFGFMIHGLSARSHAYRNQWWGAMGAARRTIGPLEDCIELLGAAPELEMVAGVYHYYVATYHKRHPIIRPVLAFFPPGDEVKGLQELNHAANQEGHLAQIEALYFLGTIYHDEVEKPLKGVAVTQRLVQRYPRNTWFQNDHARALVSAGRLGEAQQVLDRLIGNYEAQAGATERNLNSRKTRYTTYLMMRVYHHRGDVEQRRGQYRAALAWYAKSEQAAELASVEGDAYLPGNQLTIGMCHDFLGQRGQAIAAYERVLDLDENEPFKEHAKSYLRSPAQPSASGH